MKPKVKSPTPDSLFIFARESELRVMSTYGANRDAAPAEAGSASTASRMAAASPIAIRRALRFALPTSPTSSDRAKSSNRHHRSIANCGIGPGAPVVGEIASLQRLGERSDTPKPGEQQLSTGDEGA